MADEAAPQSTAAAFAEAFAEPDDAKASSTIGDNTAAETPKNDLIKDGTAEGQQSGVEGAKDGAADPLANLDVATLLKHPILGKQIQSHADKVAATKVAAATASAKTEGRQELEIEKLDAYFGSLTAAQLGRELAADEDLALAYAKHKERQYDKSQNGNSQAVAQQAEVYALATQITTNLDLLASSGLSAETLAELQPDKFVEQGPRGVIAWNAAITEAITDLKASQKTAGMTDDKLEALAAEQLAERDKRRAGALATAGRVSGGRPDLMRTPTRVLFADAFKAK